MSAARPMGPRIALWGAFDVEDCGPLATRRVVEAELLRRLPGAAVTAFSPLGSLRPLALDGGRPAEPLPAPTPAALDELRARFDCVLVCGEDSLSDGARAAELWGDGGRAPAARDLLVDGLGSEREAACPVIWAGVSLSTEPDPSRAARLAMAGGRRGPVAVLDEASRRRLGAAGVRGEIAVLPPFGVLLPRLLGDGLLRRRGDFLRVMEWSWPPGGVVTVQGDGALREWVDAIAAALLPLLSAGEARVQLSSCGANAGEEDFTSALEAALGGRCRRLPGVAPPEDQVAALSGSAAYVGRRGFGLAAARSLDIPAVVPGSAAGDDGGAVEELGAELVTADGLPATLRRLLAVGTAPPPAPLAAIDRLDRHLDGLAAVALRAAANGAETVVAGELEPGAPGQDMLRRAYEERGRRLFADRAALQAAADGAVEELQAQLDRLRSELHAARAANDGIVGSRTWRYTQPLRDARARLARHRG